MRDLQRTCRALRFTNFQKNRIINGRDPLGQSRSIWRWYDNDTVGRTNYWNFDFSYQARKWKSHLAHLDSFFWSGALSISIRFVSICAKKKPSFFALLGVFSWKQTNYVNFTAKNSKKSFFSYWNHSLPVLQKRV